MRRQEAELDRDIAALLAAMAFTEIRHLAGRPQREAQDTSHDEVLDRIRFLADLSHNLPGVARPRARRPSRGGRPIGSFDQAMTERPMSWVWNTAGPDAVRGCCVTSNRNSRAEPGRRPHLCHSPAGTRRR